MKRHTNNLGLASKMDMERQAKSRKKPCLGTKDKKNKMHITQKLYVGFLPNSHQQTRGVLVHLFDQTALPWTYLRSPGKNIKNHRLFCCHIYHHKLRAP